MKKKGFMLAEVLIVSTLLIGLLSFMFIQIKSINSAYSREFKYNTVDSLYGARVIKEYLDTKYDFNTLNTTQFININSNYFNKLVEKLGVLLIIFSNNNSVYEYLTENYDLAQNYIGANNSYYEKIIEFSTKLEFNSKKHLIILYEDGNICDYQF